MLLFGKQSPEKVLSDRYVYKNNTIFVKKMVSSTISYVHVLYGWLRLKGVIHVSPFSLWYHLYFSWHNACHCLCNLTNLQVRHHVLLCILKLEWTYGIASLSMPDRQHFTLQFNYALLTRLRKMKQADQNCRKSKFFLFFLSVRHKFVARNDVSVAVLSSCSYIGMSTTSEK